jgi:hypothetical protein
LSLSGTINYVSKYLSFKILINHDMFQTAMWISFLIEFRQNTHCIIFL